MTESVTIQFDETSGVLTGPDWRVALPRREAQVFSLLLSAKPRAVTLDYLTESIYEADQEPSGVQNVLYSHISKLRAKLKPLGFVIQSGRYRGYALDFGGLDVVRSTFTEQPSYDDVCTKQIHVTISDRSVVADLRGLAARYSCWPDHIASALIKAAIAGDLIDAIFDGEDPRDIILPRALSLKKLGRVQKSVLDWFSSQRGGSVSANFTTIAQAVGSEFGPVRAATRSLCLRGHLRLISQGGVDGSLPVYRLMEADL